MWNPRTAMIIRGVVLSLAVSAASTVMPDTATAGDPQVETVFNVSVALRADADGVSPLTELFGESVFSLPNGKVNVGVAKEIKGSCPTPHSAAD